jgi:hypothetical protein
MLDKRVANSWGGIKNKPFAPATIVREGCSSRNRAGLPSILLDRQPHQTGDHCLQLVVRWSARQVKWQYGTERLKARFKIRRLGLLLRRQWGNADGAPRRKREGLDNDATIRVQRCTYVRETDPAYAAQHVKHLD